MGNREREKERERERERAREREILKRERKSERESPFHVIFSDSVFIIFHALTMTS